MNSIKREHPSRKESRFHVNRPARGNQHGQILVLMLLSLVPLLGIGALSIDLGRAYILSTQMQHVADLASLAGVKSILKSEIIDGSKVRRSAIFTAAQNHLIESGQAEITSEDVEIGFYDLSQYIAGAQRPNFKPKNDDELNETNTKEPPNAVRVTVRLADGKNQPLSLMLARVLGIKGPLSWSRDAISVLGALNAIIAFDLSNSMVWKSYLPIKKPGETYGCESEYYNNDGNGFRQFKYAARATPSPSGIQWYSECGRSVVGPDGSETCYIYDGKTDTSPSTTAAVMPQPVTEITNSIINDLILSTNVFSRYYRLGIDFFETEAYAPHPDIQIAPDKWNNKQDVIDYLKKGMLSHWCEYASSNNRAADNVSYCTSPNGICKTADEIKALVNDIQTPSKGEYHTALFPWPGGLKYWAKGSGWTNIGNALNLALKQLRQIYDATGGLSYDTIFLLTDGQPTCEKCYQNEENLDQCCVTDYAPQTCSPADPFWCGYDNGIPARALDWAKEVAASIKEYNIDFFGIYFATTGSCTEGDVGWDNLQQITATAGGQAFCAENVNCEGDNCLRSILEKLSKKPRFFLMPD